MMKHFFSDNKSNPWFWGFASILVVFFFLMTAMSKDAGNSGDEDGFQWPYGKQVYEFYASGGKDTTCLQNDDMGMHGGFFDQLTVAVVKVTHADDYGRVRHLLNSIFGWIGILFVGLTARRLSGWRAGVLAMILLFLSPRYLGHSFNNPKDLIYASMMIAGLYYVICFIKEYPKPSIKTSILLAIFSALAIVSRFAGYLLFAYLIGFLIIYHFRKQKKGSLYKDNLKLIGKYAIYIAAIIIVSFGLTVALWPYIMSAPLKSTFSIYHEMSNYSVSIRQIFEGTMQWSDQLPWYYTPKFMLITIPVAVIFGLILFFLFCWRQKEDRFWSFLILMTFTFPIIWIIATHANVYGGWRHALFTYPPMVVAAALGFDGSIKWLETKFIGNSEQKP